MKKIKIGTGFFLIVILCLLFNKLSLLINYLLALGFHEIAHLFVAYQRGYSLKLIRLDIFGLSVELKEKIDNNDMFAINITGPLINILLCLICFTLYYFIPKSFVVLNEFCVSNFVLAVFNLVPIYPLDGGKLIKGIVKDNKKYRKIDKCIRYGFVVLFLLLFLINLNKGINYIYLVLIVFFISSQPKNIPTFSLFKQNKGKLDKIELLKVEGNEKLFELVKKIKHNKYTIFYCCEIQKYIDEDKIVEMATKYPLDAQISSIYKIF